MLALHWRRVSQRLTSVKQEGVRATELTAEDERDYHNQSHDGLSVNSATTRQETMATDDGR